MTKEKRYELLLPCPSAAIQGNIFLVPLKRIYPRYIVQYAAQPYNVGIRYFGVIIDGEQDFFFVIGVTFQEGDLMSDLPRLVMNQTSASFVNRLWRKLSP